MLYANAQTFFNIPQQMQAFQTQIQQQSQQTQRRSLFSPYLPAASLPPLLAAGKLVIGVLRVNKRVRRHFALDLDLSIVATDGWFASL